MVPRFRSKSPLFSPKVFTLIVQSVSGLSKAGEAVKAKNKKLLRRGCARTHACARESVFTRRKAGGMPERDHGPQPRAKKSGSTTKQPPPFPSGSGGGCLVGAVVRQRWGEEIPRRGEVTPVPRCGRCTVREAGDIGGILRSPFRALPSNGGDRWAVGSR